MKINTITKETTVINVNPDTGEVLSSESNIITQNLKYKTSTQEEFWFMYASFLDVMIGKNKPSAIAKDIFFWILKTYPGVFGKLSLTKEIKEDMAKDLEYTIGSINNNLPSLIKSGLILKEGRNCFRVNPKYVFKGYSKDRDLLLKIELSVDGI
jgi:hypothetical protein